MKHPRVAILASGEGTTAEAFIKAGAEGLITAQVGLIISNNEGAGIFKRADILNKKYGLKIECLHISKKNYPPNGEALKPGDQTKAEEQAILKVLRAGNFDLVALMGYVKKVGVNLVEQFGWRSSYRSPYQAMMVNTHPGLLPATKGMYGVHVQEFVINSKNKYAGQTLHIVAEDYDEGPVIAEHKVGVFKNDTPYSLFDRVKEAEKKYLPSDIDNFIKARQEYLSKEKD
jgi:phosphoribosylglycinamide formyltransferase-1